MSSGEPRRLKQKKGKRHRQQQQQQAGDAAQRSPNVHRSGRRHHNRENGNNGDDSEVEEKSTDRELFADMKRGEMKDPRKMTQRERELIAMPKQQLIDIIMCFEKKYGRRALALAMMGDLGDDSSDDDDDDEDAREPYNENTEELRVRNLDTGDTHGEGSIDEFMADPKMITKAKVIMNLDSGELIDPVDASRRIEKPKLPPTPSKAKRVSGWFKRKFGKN